jgi:probable HAF family extracellular repeat protein
MKTHHVPRPAGYLLAVLLLSVVPGQAPADFIPIGGGLIATVALGVSSDGTTVVGSSASSPFIVAEAFLWTQATGMVGLGTLPGYSNSRATSVSGNGTVVVGWSFVQPVLRQNLIPLD